MARARNFVVDRGFEDLGEYNTHHFPVTSEGHAVEFGLRRVKVSEVDVVGRGPVVVKYILLSGVGGPFYRPHGLVMTSEYWSVIDAREEIMQWLLQGLLRDGTRA